MSRILKWIKWAIIILIIYVAASMTWQLISLSVNNANISGEIREMLIGEIRADEYEVAERVLKFLKEKNIYLEYSELDISKPNSNAVHVHFTYTDSIGIPLINKYFYMDKEVDETVRKR